MADIKQKQLTLDNIKFNFDELLNFNKYYNNVHDESAIASYEADSSTKQQYYPLERVSVIDDGADRLMMYLGFARQQLLLSLLDDFGLINYDLKENTPLELFSFPQDVIQYDNIAYRESVEYSIGNANVPVGWNIAKTKNMNIGDYIIPEEALEYVKKQRADGMIPDANIIKDIPRYEKCMEALEAMIDLKEELGGHPIMCLAGAFAVESSWVFENVINPQEFNEEGAKGTGGASGCGESWFGLTFWGTKLQIINGLNLTQYGISNNENEYGKGGAKSMICGLPLEKQAEVAVYFISDVAYNRGGKLLLEFNEGDQTDNDALQCIGAGFVFKAGNWKNSGDLWEDALDAVKHYDNPNYDGLALQMYMSMMFSYWYKYDKVPDCDPWDADTNIPLANREFKLSNPDA